jgi:hypothetical protein
MTQLAFLMPFGGNRSAGTARREPLGGNRFYFVPARIVLGQDVPG